MDRNTVIGLILIGTIFVVFSILNRPSKEEMEAARRRADSLELVRQLELQKELEKANNAQILQAEDITSKKDTAQIKKMQDELGAFASGLSGNDEFITLENDKMLVKFSRKGGRPYSVQLKEYTAYDSTPVTLFQGDSTIFSLDFFSQNRTISTQNLYFSTVDSLMEYKVKDDSATVLLRLYAGEDRYLEYAYTLKPGSYRLNFRINMVGLQDIIASNTNNLDFRWEINVPQQEKGRQNENQYTNIAYKYSTGEVENFSTRTKKEEDKKQFESTVRWIAFKQQFFSSVLIAEDPFSNGLVTSYNKPDNSPYLKRFSTVVGIPFNPALTKNVDLSFYFGPNHYRTLKKEGDDLQELVFLGKWIIKWVNQFVIIPIFNWLNQFIGNYGLIILILTIIIKVALLPLTYGSYRSMAKMRVLKPQIDEINVKIPKEKAMERQQAVMALYRKAGVNPMGGCLPLLLQMPILFAMFRFFPTSFELRHQGFLWATDLSTYDAIVEWDTYIPILSSIYGNHVSLFTILMTITTILSIKMNNQATAASTQQLPGMQTMMYIMPVMFMFFLNSFSSALTYYYFLTNIITFGQNWLFKNMINEEALLQKLNENKKKPVKKSKFQQALEDAAKKRGVNPPKR